VAIEFIPENEIIGLVAHLQTLHTLEVAFPSGEIKRWAGRDITINGAAYEGKLLSISGFRRASGAGIVDRVSVEIDNLDWSHSLRILNDRPREYSKAIVGKLFRDYRSNGQWIWQVLIRGVVASPFADHRAASYSVISDLAAAPQVGATRIASKTCQWRYKDSHCAAASALLTCNKAFNAPGGCIDHGVDPLIGNTWRFGGIVFDTEKATLLYPPPNPGGGGDGTGDGGGGYDGFNPFFLA